MFVTGAYRGKGNHLPPGGGDPCDDDLDTAGFTMRGQAFVDEVEDVVFLRKVFRLDDKGLEHMAPEERETYVREAHQFRDVMLRMSKGELTRADHEWLCQFQRSRLLQSERGSRKLDDCASGVMLMDTKRDTQDSEEGANRVNFNRRVRHAQESVKNRKVAGRARLWARRGGY